MPSNERWQALVNDPAALLGVLFDHMPMGIALFDRDLILRAFNPTWASYIERYGPPEARPLRAGLPVRDVLGRKVVYPDWLRQVVETVLAGETVRREAVELVAGDRVGWLDFVHAPIVDGGEIAGFVEVCLDVTERVLANQRARHLASIVETTDDAVVAGDLNGKIISWNGGAERLYGYSAAEAIGGSVTMLYPPDLSSSLPGVTEQIMRGERIEQFETRRMRKGGEVIDAAITFSPIVSPSGEVIGISSITRDVTARKRAEEALRERESQYRSIFETSRDGLAVTAEGSSRLVAANPAFCTMFGYAHADVVQMDWTDFIHPDDHERVQAVAPGVERGGEFRMQATCVDARGGSFPAELHAVSFVYLGQNALLAVVRDISEQMRAMELLEERVAERTRELASLLEVSRTVASTMALEPLLVLIFEQLNQFIVEYVGATIWLFEGDMVYAAASTVVPGIQGIRAPLPREELPWSAILQARPAVIDDVLDDTPLARSHWDTNPQFRPAPSLNVRSWAGVPLLFKEQVTGMLAVSSSEPGFFTPRRIELLSAIASQSAVAVENIRLLSEAQGRAALEERQRLARELHDSVSQALYGIALGARTARTLLDRNAAKAAEPMDYVLALAEAGLAEMRALIFELRPESLEEEGLVAALEKQAAALRARHRIDVIAVLPDEPEAPLAVKEAIYRIAQEALHNTVKHAKARRVDLQLSEVDGGLRLEVRDDGRGFDPDGDFPGHLGLRSMRERAARAGGVLEIVSTAGAGAGITLWTPVT